jgi:hypothetical protein
LNNSEFIHNLNPERTFNVDRNFSKILNSLLLIFLIIFFLNLGGFFYKPMSG